MFNDDEKFSAAIRDLAEHEMILVEADPEVERWLDEMARLTRLYITEERVEGARYLRVSLHDDGRTT